MGRRSSLTWVVVFVALAVIGTGGGKRVGDLVSDDGGSSGSSRGGSRHHGSDSGPQPSSSLRGRVIRVVDGDTIKVLLQPGRYETVRYIGIDTPESVKPDTPVQCFAKQASAYNERLVQGREVRLTVGRERRDRYGRLLAYVYTSDPRVFVNAVLVREGYARTLEIPPNTDRASYFARLENRAVRDGRGLWSACP